MSGKRRRPGGRRVGTQGDDLNLACEACGGDELVQVDDVTRWPPALFTVIWSYWAGFETKELRALRCGACGAWKILALVAVER